MIFLWLFILLSGCATETFHLEQWYFTLYKPGRQAVTMGPYIDRAQCEDAAYDLRSMGVTKDGKVFSYTPACEARVFFLEKK